MEKQLQNAVNAVLNGFANEALKQTMQEPETRQKHLQHSIETAPTALPKFTLEQFRLILGKIASESPRSLLDTFEYDRWRYRYPRSEAERNEAERRAMKNDKSE